MLDTRKKVILTVEAAKTQRLWLALSSFAGRVAQSDDPKAHQSAAQRLQADLRTSHVNRVLDI